MRKLHPFWLVLIGWAIALVVPPNMLFGMFKGGAKPVGG